MLLGDEAHFVKQSRVILLLLCCFTLAACSRATQLTVINKSSSTFTNLVASGSGFSQPLGILASGAQQRVTLPSHGESDLKLAFDADGKHVISQADCYFENGYKVSATINPDFTVAVNTTLPQ